MNAILVYLLMRSVLIVVMLRAIYWGFIVRGYNGLLFARGSRIGGRCSFITGFIAA